MSLDRRTIAAAALDLLDEVGLEGVTTRRLAERLGVRGPSLYWHFKTKDLLFDHMADAMFADAIAVDDAVLKTRAWDEWLAAGARVIRRAALSRRDGARLLAGRRPAESVAILAVRPMVERLAAAGFPAPEAHYAFQTLSRFAIGWALNEQAAQARGGEEPEAGFEYGLAVILEGFRGRLAAGLSSRGSARA
ncbi:MAG: TetR family transcriptional regulator [Phenylobacterium sp.]|uniref:TetR family transcriptional regulator n=1 Tax=Phenylobacterium sp. TaxID=1871053 RepID=UPI00391DA4AC